ncbi:MAG: hypothetical protein RL095_1322 [Verrucomicrobiota bacterium]|jgi:cytochrome c551/c552
MSNPVWNTGVVMTLGVAFGCATLIAVEGVKLRENAHQGYAHHNGGHAVAVKAEAPKAEAPKAEAPKAEAPKAEAPKAEAPKAPAVDMVKAKAVLPKAAMCAACHQPDAPGAGPSIKMIAARLGADEALIKAAAASVVSGTAGKASNYKSPIPMPPNAGINAEEAELLVRYMIATGKITP